MIEIVKGSTQKPVSAERLVEIFKDTREMAGVLYVGYPVLPTAEGSFPIDAILLSPTKGIIVFDLIENRLDSDYAERQDDIANKLEAKLRNYKKLMTGRNFTIPITTVSFLPSEKDSQGDPTHNVCSPSNIVSTIDAIDDQEISQYDDLVSILQSISTIRKGNKPRVILKEDSRGAILRKLEDSIATLDNQQAKAVIETVEGVQRIRGLAGSGKTIVLALKAAYLHAQHRDWKIAVTFNTRSLKGQFKRLINTFVIEQTNEEPNWENLRIIHAWGAPGGGERDGIYYNFCLAHNIEYFDYRKAKAKFGEKDPFGEICKKALSELKDNNAKTAYDAILIDEAQDFSPAFLKLCYEILPEKKRLVYAYDELQNLNGESLPAPDIIFGKKKDGTPKVQFDSHSQDIILEKCYRNSRPILTTAHALGFGIYRVPNKETGTGLIQMFENHMLWEDVGYAVDSGELQDGHNVTLKRTEKSSPKFLEEHSTLDDLIQFHDFENVDAQNEWLVKEIEKNLKEDELRADDIIVINTNPLSTRDNVGKIRSLLFEKKISTHLAGVDTVPDIFFQPDSESIPFTGIYRAKGNEAGMVYIIHAQDCYSSPSQLATVRNRLFTAITRSKAWVRVLGVGQNMRMLKDEFIQVQNHNFTLEFTYPTEKQRSLLNVVNRDMTPEERKKTNKMKRAVRDLLEQLESGMRLEDIGLDEVEALKKFITTKE